MLDWSAALKVIGISAIPFLELRLGIPAGMGWGLSPGVAIGLGIAGNLFQVPLVLFFMHTLRRIGQQVGFVARWLESVDKTAEKYSHVVRRYGWLGLAVLVGIPIPGTGIWTGAALAILFRMPHYLAAISLGLGIVISGLLVGAVATGAFAMIRLF